MSDTRVHPRHLADYLLECGERFITSERCAELLRVKPENVSRSLAPVRHANQMMSVTNRARGTSPATKTQKKPRHIYWATWTHLTHGLNNTGSI